MPTFTEVMINHVLPVRIQTSAKAGDVEMFNLLKEKKDDLDDSTYIRLLLSVFIN